MLSIFLARGIGRLFAASCLLISASGCVSLSSLNDPTRGVLSPDMTSKSQRAILYETLEKEGLSVSYNFTAQQGGLDLAKLSLIIRNNTNSDLVVSPRIRIQDVGGFVIEPYSYESFVRLAASMAGTQVPSIPTSNTGSTYYSTGNVTNNMTGNSVSYSSTTTSIPSAGQSFNQGFNQGRAIAAAAEKNAGVSMLAFAETFWLKSQYLLPPQGAVAGAVIYPRNKFNLPLKLEIDVNGIAFQFTTISDLK